MSGQRGRPTSNHAAVAALGSHELTAWLYRQRLKGYTLDQIAALAALPVTAGGYDTRISRATVYRRLKDELDERKEHLAADVERYRALELDRLDGLMVLALELGSAEDPDGYRRPQGARLAAIATVLKVSESRRKLLGLDAPLKVEAEVVTVDKTDQAIAKLLEAVHLADRAAAGLV